MPAALVPLFLFFFFLPFHFFPFFLFSFFLFSYHCTFSPFSRITYHTLLPTYLFVNSPKPRAIEAMLCDEKKARECLQPIRPIYKLSPTTTPTTPPDSEIVHIVIQRDSEGKDIIL